MKDEKGRAILLCSECREPVRVIDGRHKCDCEESPEGYRFADHEMMMELLGVEA
jgi:hypothetical protein